MKIHTFPNGLTLLGEEMDFVSSAAFSLLVPFGAVKDPDNQEGLSSIMTDMFVKGAGPWDSRQLSQTLEDIGAHHSGSAGTEVAMFSGGVLGENLVKMLDIVSTMLFEPRFPEEELESIRQLALQELRSLEDEPSSKVMVELSKLFYPHPFGRSQMGTIESVQAITIDHVREHYKKNFLASGAILGVAGKFDWDEVKAMVEKRFGAWGGKSPLLEVKPYRTELQVHHIEKDTNQLQIALAYPSISYGHSDYYTARVTSGILSGGMAGRLFIEVREKRGLVYRVSSSHSASRGRGAVISYAGTTPENGQECLNVIVEELRKLNQGVSADELNRAKADLKSRLVMQGESTSMRASALVNDWWNLGKVRKLEEIKAGIDAVTSADIARHAVEFPCSPMTLVTIGNTKLSLPQ